MAAHGNPTRPDLAIQRERCVQDSRVSVGRRTGWLVLASKMRQLVISSSRSESSLEHLEIARPAELSHYVRSAIHRVALECILAVRHPISRLRWLASRPQVLDPLPVEGSPFET